MIVTSPSRGRPGRGSTLCLFLWTLLPIFAAPAPTPRKELPTSISPQTALVSFATAHGIPLDVIEPPADSANGRIGDSFTALITLREGKSQKQWLTRFRTVERNEEERGKTITEGVTMTVNGRATKFTATRNMAVEIRTAGPFIEGRKPPEAEKEARALTSPTFLRLGFDKVSRLLALMMTAANKATGPTGGSITAVKPPELTDDQLRTLSGVLPTLTAFYGTIENTPGLREILWDMIDKPSVWSLAKNRGVKPGFDLNGVKGAKVDLAGWDLAASAELYELPIRLDLNGEPALLCTLFVTSPRPPLLASAGVVGIVAESPDKKKRVDIRVVSARRGPQNKPAIAKETPAEK